MSFKFLVAFENNVCHADGSQQKFLLRSKEGHRFESLDAILLLPLAKVPREVVVNATAEHQQEAQEGNKVDGSEYRDQKVDQHFWETVETKTDALETNSGL